MPGVTGLHLTGLAVLVLFLTGACAPGQQAHVQSSPAAPVHTFAGGCAGTVLTNAEPPLWTQGGFSHTKGTPWGVPWAPGSGGNAVAFVFARQLVAGTSPRADGTNNKVLWVVKGTPTNFVVEGIPPGRTKAVVSVNGGPSIVDVPSPGCWKFQLTWGAAQVASTINLDVLPHGSLPPSEPA